KKENVNDIRPRILAVDDDLFNLTVLKNILPVEDYDVVTATSEKKALELIDMGRFHLIISDIMMPNISGYELTKTIRERYSLLEFADYITLRHSQVEKKLNERFQLVQMTLYQSQLD